MKKSKIIVPALGILCLSTAAAVTGTVAWFTASRLEQISMSNITVVNPETGLSVLLKNNVNCKIGDDGKSVTHGLVGSDQGYLRDASVDLSGNNAVVYKADVNDNGGIDSYSTQAIGTADTKAYQGHAVYYATSFTMSFSALNNDPDNVNNSLFFSPNLSSATLPELAAGKTRDKAYSALRIGLKAGTEWFVWAPFYNATQNDGSTANRLQYVGGTTYGGSEVNLTPDTNAVVNNDEAGSIEAALNDSNGAIAKTTGEGFIGYMGILPATAQTSLDVEVYTWFEGTDAYCNEDFWTEIQTGAQANLVFVSRNVAKA